MRNPFKRRKPIIPESEAITMEACYDSTNKHTVYTLVVPSFVGFTTDPTDEELEIIYGNPETLQGALLQLLTLVKVSEIPTNRTLH